MWCIIASLSPAEIFYNKLLVSSTIRSWLFVCKKFTTSITFVKLDCKIGTQLDSSLQKCFIIKFAIFAYFCPESAKEN